MNSDNSGSSQDLTASDGTWTLITVTYNSADKLAEYWSSVKWQGGQSWVVVDNNSSDDSVNVARSLGAEVIPLSNNVGFGRANNIGMRASASEFVGFVNPDVTPVAQDLSALGEYLRQHNVLLAPQLVFPDGSLQPNGRGKPFLLNKILHRIAPDLDTGYRKFAATSEEVVVDWLTGAVVLGNRSTLSHLGPWNEAYFVYYEDTDLGLRAAESDIESIVYGSYRWTHGWARATKGLNLKAWRREIDSMIRFYASYPQFIVRAPKPDAKRLRTSARQEEGLHGGERD